MISSCVTKKPVSLISLLTLSISLATCRIAGACLPNSSNATALRCAGFSILANASVIRVNCSSGFNLAISCIGRPNVFIASALPDVDFIRPSPMLRFSLWRLMFRVSASTPARRAACCSALRFCADTPSLLLASTNCPAASRVDLMA